MQPETNPMEQFKEQFDWRVRIFDSLSFPTLVLNLRREVIAVNRIYLDHFKLMERDVIGKSCSSDVPGFLNHNVKECSIGHCPHLTAIETGKVQYVEVQRVDQSGQTIWEERVVSPIFDDMGDIEYVIESIRNITRVKNLERKYSEMRELIDKVVQSSVSGIIAADRKGNIILMNDAAEKLFGYTIFDANNINIEDFYPPGVAREIMRKLRDESIGGKGKLPLSRHYIVTAKGEQIPVEMTAAIIYEGEKEAATAAIFNDLREKQAVAKKLEEAEVQLVQSEKLASIGRLAAGVAHEINNPLTSIMMYGSLISEQLGPTHPLAHHLKIVLEDTARCTGIVKNLLAYSRQASPSRAAFFLNNLINESLGLIRDQKMFMNVEVIKRFDPKQIMVYADKNQLCQVIINLIINAFDAMEGKGTLTLSTYRHPTRPKAFIEISDTGCGIPAADQSKIFEPFFTTKEPGKGTGLGLSMAYGIMHENGGDISIKETGPTGTTILLELPEERTSDGFSSMTIG